MGENQNIEYKSIRCIIGNSADWSEIAKDCVSFANARGGTIFIGIENNAIMPPLDQRIDADLPDQIRKRISELTVNVGTHTEIKVAENKGEFIALKVFPCVSTIACTTDGRYYLRIADTCTPLPPDELMRLMTDKPAFTWETKVVKTVSRKSLDQQKLDQFVSGIRESNRVSAFIKEKAPDEMLDYYLMAEGDYLTNLGVLWVGKRIDRAKLLYAPLIQFLKYDENGDRVNKIVWDDFSMNPHELIEVVWTQIPDWKEGIEISDGMFRKFIPNYEEDVIRELIANALVHRPYTTRGDIFINLYPGRLEVHNPGRLPIGVTPENILHKTVRRNEHLSQIFYSLKLMEKEGSGFDKMYEILLSNGKEIPVAAEGDDRVTITVRKRILKDEVIKLVSRANEQYQLRQKEIICFALVAQHNSLSAIEFSKLLNLTGQQAIHDWVGRLLDLGLIQTKGRTKGVEYFVNPDFLRKSNFQGKTDLKKIEIHRLRELIHQDISSYPNSAVSEIHNRIGSEIPVRKVKSLLYKMVEDGSIGCFGDKKWRRYSINQQ